MLLALEVGGSGQLSLKCFPSDSVGPGERLNPKEVSSPGLSNYPSLNPTPSLEATRIQSFELLPSFPSCFCVLYS